MENNYDNKKQIKKKKHTVRQKEKTKEFAQFEKEFRKLKK